MIDKKYQEEVAAANPVERYFKVMSGADWMAEANSMPLRKKLAGDLWFEGENAVLFAENRACIRGEQEITRGDGVVADMISAAKYYFDDENAFELINTDSKGVDFGDVEY